MSLKKTPTLMPLLWTVFVGCGSTEAPPAPEVPDGQPRHVLMISMDTVRADALGAWGSTTGATPFLDALAARSVTFIQHTSSAPTTLASHTSLMTGRYPHNHGVPRNEHRVHEANAMLAERFGEVGFQTAAFLGAMPLASHSGFLQGFSHVDARFDRHPQKGLFNQTERSGDQVTDAVLEWVDDGDPSKSRLFLFAHYFDAHQPYLPSVERRNQVGATGTQASLDEIRAFAGTLSSTNQEGPTAVELRGLYAAEVAGVDHEVGRLLNGLAARGVTDVLVVIWADHGEGWTHATDRFYHGYGVYQETVHTPLIWSEPGFSPEVVSQAVSAVDIAPTLEERFGLPARPSDGVDITPLLRGQGIEDRALFSEATKPLEPQAGWLNGNRLKSVRMGTLKLIWNPVDDAVQLYDLVRDPNETRDLSKQPGREADVARLRGLVQSWAEQANPLPTERVESGAVLDQLRDLGYLE